MSKEIRRTRFYTINYNIYHRKKTCWYLRKTKKIDYFLIYEPYIESGNIVFSLDTGQQFEIEPCNRCGK